MITIHKYALRQQNTNEVVMPAGAKILSVQVQNASPFLWALVDTDRPEEIRKIRMVGTGHEINPESLVFIDTFQLPKLGLVFHVFEITN